LAPSGRAATAMARAGRRAAVCGLCRRAAARRALPGQRRGLGTVRGSPRRRPARQWWHLARDAGCGSRSASPRAPTSAAGPGPGQAAVPPTPGCWRARRSAGSARPAALSMAYLLQAAGGPRIGRASPGHRAGIRQTATRPLSSPWRRWCSRVGPGQECDGQAGQLEIHRAEVSPAGWWRDR
jgi:hypothetical protein